MKREDCNRALIKAWSRNSVPPPTWGNLLDVLQKFNLQDTVEKVKKYMKPSLKNKIAVEKRRKEEEKSLLAAVEEIMRKEGELEQTIMQGVFIGPAGSGKSSLMRRLLSENLLQLTSTPVAKKVIQVNIKQPSVAAAEITCSSSNAPWSRLSFDDEVLRLLKTLFQSRINPQSSDRLPIRIKQDSKVVFKAQIPMQPETAPTLHTQESQELSPNMENAQTYIPESPAIGTKASPNVPKFRTHQEVFKDSLRKGWPQARKHFQGACIMYLTDTGGQLEFQELVSALVSGPSVFFLVFRLDCDLNTTFDIVYTDPDKGSSKPYRSSIILKDALLQSLASIASMGRFTYTREGMELEPLQPKVFFIGTHKDKVKQETIEKIDTELKLAVKSTAFYREGLVQPAFASDHPDSMRMLLTVNNLSEDDSDFVFIRKAVERVINQDDFKVRAPPQWLIFSLVLRQEVAQPVISYEQCRSLANECGINDEEELDKALLFLSTRVGLIRYFSKTAFKDLSKIVIRDPKILFNKISELVVETFTFQKVNNPYVCEQFVRKGIFLQSDFEKISTKTKDDILTAKMLIDLLKYLHIIAPIHKEGEKPKFFMPCILHHAYADLSCPVPEMTDYPAIPPLLVCFKCGYCPKGVFPALIAYLLNNRMESKYQWILKENEIFKNRVGFCIRSFPYTIHLKLSPSYIEILCISSESQAVICKDIITSIQMGTDQVLSDLNYTVDTRHYFAFYCRCTCKLCASEHGAEFDCRSAERPRSLNCWLCYNSSVRIPDGYHFWFPENEDLDQEGSSGTPKYLVAEAIITEDSTTRKRKKDSDHNGEGVNRQKQPRLDRPEGDGDSGGDSGTGGSGGDGVTGRGGTGGATASVVIQPLTTNDHPDITTYLHGTSPAILQQLGIVLGIHSTRLQNTHSSTFLNDLVSLWLQRVDQVDAKGGPTWATLEGAMRHVTVGMTGKADAIKRSFSFVNVHRTTDLKGY